MPAIRGRRSPASSGSRRATGSPWPERPRTSAPSSTPSPPASTSSADWPAGAPVDLALLFVTSRHDLADRFLPLAAHLPPAGALWVAWPKKSSGPKKSGIATDLTEDVLREVCLPLGWVDTKVCAVTDVWSGLKFVLRKENRPRTG